MKNSLFLVITLVCATIAGFPSPSSAKPSFTVASIEWMVANSDWVIVGKVIKVERTAKHDIVTAEVHQTLRSDLERKVGEIKPKVTFVLQEYCSGYGQGWLEDGLPMIFCLAKNDGANGRERVRGDFQWVLHDNGHGNSAVLLGKTKRTWPGTTDVFTRKFDHLTEPAAIIKFIGDYARSIRPERVEKSITVDVPYDTPAYTKVSKWRASAFYLRVPIDIDELGDEGFVDSGGVKIHYVASGKGPLVILLHGFPDYWYTWRDQMPALAKSFQVVAIDLRGFNKSDQPKGVESYAMSKLIGDVDAVRKHFKQEKAIIVGHDWGGAIAWGYAMTHPDKTDRLIILNLPHPKGLRRELATNPQQQKSSEYARAFQQEDAAKKLTPELLTMWVKEPEARKKYLEAMKRSSLDGMLNYYKANYPRPPYKDEMTYPQVKCPVLMIHGLDDPYLLPGALNDTWKWVDKDFTLVTVPKAGHWVHRDASDLVTKRMVRWLAE